MKRTTPSRMIGIVSVSFVLLTALHAEQHPHEQLSSTPPWLLARMGMSEQQSKSRLKGVV